MQGINWTNQQELDEELPNILKENLNGLYQYRTVILILEIMMRDIPKPFIIFLTKLLSGQMMSYPHWITITIWKPIWTISIKISCKHFILLYEWIGACPKMTTGIGNGIIIHPLFSWNKNTNILLGWIRLYNYVIIVPFPKGRAFDLSCMEVMETTITIDGMSSVRMKS